MTEKALNFLLSFDSSMVTDRVARIVDPARRNDGPGGDKLVLSWPSGHGVEVGYVDLTVDRAWDLITSNSAAADQDFRLDEIEEDGAKALAISGFAGKPITFVLDPDRAKPRLAIYADAKAAVARVGRSLRAVLPGADLVLYD